jgi:hypothetical protein
MKCPVCSARIDDDARFCDQCGVELFRCPRCGTAGRGPVCTKDGSPLGRFAIAAHQPAQHPGREAVIVLRNATLGLRLEVNDGDILGRKEGRHAAVLAGQASVSGRHAAVKREGDGGWTITDLDSTNGTMVDGTCLTPGRPVAFRRGSHVVIANIEFEVTG